MTKPLKRPPIERRAFRITELCLMTGLSRSSVYRRIADGEIKTVRFGGVLLIPADTVSALLKAAE